ncbi:hypothetical protein KM043_007983 [Ampulex compressa]|nr:hypothetical protein KM043_007983 [Ampulex compressa]
MTVMILYRRTYRAGRKFHISESMCAEDPVESATSFASCGITARRSGPEPLDRAGAAKGEDEDAGKRNYGNLVPPGGTVVWNSGLTNARDTLLLWNWILRSAGYEARSMENST